MYKWPETQASDIFFLLLALCDVSESEYPKYGHMWGQKPHPPAVLIFSLWGAANQRKVG